MRGVMLDRASIDRGDLDLAPLLALPIDWRFHDRTPDDRIDEHLAGAEIVLTNKVVLDRARLQRHRHIRLIGVLATGTDNVDLDAATEQRIAVKNVRDYGTTSVAQHVFLLLLMLARQQNAQQRAVARGDWSRGDQFCLLDHPIDDLAGKTLGIIGYGTLGRAVARLGKAFGMTVMIAERAGQQTRPGRQPFERVIATADALSLHCPLTPQTEKLIDAAVLEAMLPSAWLINTARGGLIDETALAWALDHGIIAGAALDVLGQEPPPANHPLLAVPRDNLIVTPHIAWAARSARQRIIDLTADNIRAFLAPAQRNIT